MRIVRARPADLDIRLAPGTSVATILRRVQDRGRSWSGPPRHLGDIIEGLLEAYIVAEREDNPRGMGEAINGVLRVMHRCLTCRSQIMEPRKGLYCGPGCSPPRGFVGARVHLISLMKDQDYLCGLCGMPLPPAMSKIHVDHIRPRSKGGTDDYDNLQATHERCNRKKGNKWDGRIIHGTANEEAAA